MSDTLNKTGVITKVEDCEGYVSVTIEGEKYPQRVFTRFPQGKALADECKRLEGQTVAYTLKKNDKGYFNLHFVEATEMPPNDAKIQKTGGKPTDVKSDTDWDLIGVLKTRCALAESALQGIIGRMVEVEGKTIFSQVRPELDEAFEWVMLPKAAPKGKKQKTPEQVNVEMFRKACIEAGFDPDDGTDRDSISQLVLDWNEGRTWSQLSLMAQQETISKMMDRVKDVPF